jgi:hypothetical protein
MSTHTYAILEVSPLTWQDIKNRLESVDSLRDYLDGDLLVLGTVALKAEKDEPSTKKRVAG